MLGRCVYLVALILLLTGLYACWCGTALTWDGAYQLGQTLIRQRPYAYGTRLHSWLLWLPTVGLSHATHNIASLRFVFGLPFALAPVAGLLASWWVVRRHAPGLIVWAVFGIAVAPLPGQVFLINDSLFQQHLFWPVFLGLFVPLTGRQRAALLVLALFQLSHPIGLVLLGIGAAAGALVACRTPTGRRSVVIWTGVLAALALLALVKLLIWPDAQAADEFHWLVAQNRWRKGVSGPPLAGLSLFWLAGGLVFARALVSHTSRPRAVQWLPALAFAAALAGGAVWVTWATDERQWAFALDYRRWLVPLTLPFFVLCTLEGMQRGSTGQRTAPPHAPPPPPQVSPSWRVPVCYLSAATFAAVLAVQSTLWAELTRHLMQDVDGCPSAVVPRAAVSWIERTPLQHWGLPMYVALLQGPAPRKVLVYDTADRAALRSDPPRVPVTPWESWPPEPGPGGWFDYRPFVERMRAEGVIGG